MISPASPCKHAFPHSLWHRDPDCRGTWCEHDSGGVASWRCDACRVMYSRSEAFDAAADWDRVLSELAGTLTREGGQLLAAERAAHARAWLGPQIFRVLGTLLRALRGTAAAV